VGNGVLMLDTSTKNEDAYDGDESSNGGDLDNPLNIKHRFRDLAWSRSNFTFELPQKPFLGA